MMMGQDEAGTCKTRNEPEKKIRDAYLLEPEKVLGVDGDQRLPERAVHLAAQDVKVVCRRRYIDDLHVAVLHLLRALGNLRPRGEVRVG